MGPADAFFRKRLQLIASGALAYFPATFASSLLLALFCMGV
jgi:hypothetical protein